MALSRLDISSLKYTFGVGLLCLVPIVFHLIQFLVSTAYGIYDDISSEVKLSSLIDVVSSSVVLFSLLLYFKPNILRMKMHWMYSPISRFYLTILWVFGIFFFLCAVVGARDVIFHVIAGVGRQRIYDEYGGFSFLLSAADKYFLVSVVFVLLLPLSKYLKLFYFACFLFTTVAMTSRANVMFFLMVFMIIVLIEVDLKSILKVFLLGCVLVAVATIIGRYVQMRDQDAVFLIGMKPVEDFFLYRSYSLVLAEVSIEYSALYEKYFYPFFGYVSEYLARLNGSENLVDSDFVIAFHRFESDVRSHSANVLYPWWSWFYGSYGIAGHALKSCYMIFLFFLSVMTRSFPIFVYTLYILIIVGAARHPFLTLDSVLILFFVVVIGMFHKLGKRRFYEY